MRQSVYVGRFCPIHAGHESIIRTMMAFTGVKNSMIIIGSSNAPFSLRNFFSYSERKGFIREIFPEVRVMGLPDFQSDELWLEALDDQLIAAGIDPRKAVYYGGCREDVRFFVEDGREVKIINRFGKEQISATQIRDLLIHKQYQEVKRILNPLISEQVIVTFARKWEDFKKI
jgi:nicotinamide mononucleotide adenylyltransferase